MPHDYRCSVCRMAAFDLDGRDRCRWCRANPAPVECAGDCGRQAARTVDGVGLCAHCDLDDAEPHREGATMNYDRPFTDHEAGRDILAANRARRDHERGELLVNRALAAERVGDYTRMLEAADNADRNLARGDVHRQTVTGIVTRFEIAAHGGEA